MLHVTVPTYKQVSTEDGRPFTMYQVHVHVSGRTHIVDKRYREFHSMHKQIKKSLGIDTPDFPPKKMWQLSTRGIEHRRMGLETYIQAVMDGNRVPKSLLNFLRVKNFKTSSYDSLDDLGQDPSSNHQPVMVFEDDLFVSQSTDDNFADILNDGVRQGLFEDSDSDSTHS